MHITMSSAPELVMDVLKAKLVPFLSSSPGIGKSSLAAQLASSNNLELIDIRLSQCDPADLLGLPFLKGNKAAYMPMNIFPLADDPLPVGKDGWLILLDEFNSASLAVQAAAYRLVLDRQVGMYHLHPRTLLMAAGNLSTDKAIVNRQSTAMQSRLIHFTLDVDVPAWIRWADKADVDHRVKSFINFKPEALHRFDPNHNEETFPCPRTWEFLSRLIKPHKELTISKMPLLAGAIGEGMAREFYSFNNIYGDIPTIEQIKKDPENVKFGDDPSMHYALSGLISHHLSVENANILMKFLQRLNIDFQVITLRASLAKNIKIKDTIAVKDWIQHNAKELSTE